MDIYMEQLKKILDRGSDIVPIGKNREQQEVCEDPLITVKFQKVTKVNLMSITVPTNCNYITGLNY